MKEKTTAVTEIHGWFEYDGEAQGFVNMDDDSRAEGELVDLRSLLPNFGGRRNPARWKITIEREEDVTPSSATAP